MSARGAQEIDSRSSSPEPVSQAKPASWELLNSGRHQLGAGNRGKGSNLKKGQQEAQSISEEGIFMTEQGEGIIRKLGLPRAMAKRPREVGHMCREAHPLSSTLLAYDCS